MHVDRNAWRHSRGLQCSIVQQHTRHQAQQQLLVPLLSRYVAQLLLLLLFLLLLLLLPLVAPHTLTACGHGVVNFGQHTQPVYAACANWGL